MNKTHLTTTFCLLLYCFSSFSQEGEMTRLPLEDMGGFESHAGNWQIVGEVVMDPSVDIHEKSQETAKKKKRKKAEPEPRAVSFDPGTGILLNLPDETRKDNLVTTWSHGDILLELEVMLPKGSNSGIYLQGRYEIQLLDSWGVRDAKFSDIGGIYRNWETETEKIYMGKAPLVNAAKAPGLWQQMVISFQAPRFNEGEKTANARLHYVELNGVRIHENVEIPRLTGGAIGQEEVSEGPLMIQGDHGPVAFRNIRYKMMKEPEIELSNLTYKAFKGQFETVEDMLMLDPVKTGSIGSITHEVADADYGFGVLYNGELRVPEAGRYYFSGSVGGIAVLKVDNKEVFNGWRNVSGSVELEEGSFPFELVYYNYQSWVKPRLGLTVAGENTYPLDLHSFSSAPPDEGVVSPIFIDVNGGPKLLRAFLDYEGQRSKRLTHTIGVGEPNIHYVYNMDAGNLVCVWKGNFVDATPMWHDRGDGSFVPRGMVRYLSDGPAVAVLPKELSTFPDRSTAGNYQSKGYALDSVGRPSFKYAYEGVEITDKVYPDEGSARFVREVSFSNVPENMFFKLADGIEVQELADKTYIIGDKEYYITVISGEQPIVRKIGGKHELVVPVNSRSLIYSITW